MASTFSSLWIEGVARLPESQSPVLFDTWWKWVQPSALEIVGERIAPAMIGFSGLFHAMTSAGPLAVLFAFGFLFDRGGARRAFALGVGRRFPLLGGWLLVFFTVGAVCSIFRFFLITLGPVYFKNQSALEWLQLALIIDFIGSGFDHFCAVFIQVCLMGVVLIWIEGKQPDEGFIAATMRRFVQVLPFCGCIVFATMILLQAPHLAAGFGFLPVEFADEFLWAFERWVAILLVLHCSLQVRLMQQGGGLRKALRGNVNFLIEFWLRTLAFLVISSFVYCAIDFSGAMLAGATSGSAAGLLFLLVIPFAKGWVHGFLLAGWVILYRNATLPRATVGIAY